MATSARHRNRDVTIRIRNKALLRIRALQTSHHRVSLFNFDFSGANVLSISTLEHVGTGDYGVAKTESSPDALAKLVDESATCLLTMPIGYNPILDNHLAAAAIRPDVRVTIIWRGPKFNNWKVTTDRRVI